MKTFLLMVMRNRLGLAGLALGLVSLGNILIFTFIDFIGKNVNPYIGILAYMVAPAFLIFSLLLVAGAYWRERSRKAGQAALLYPRLDLNDPHQRSLALSFTVFLAIFVTVSAAGSYKAYEHTESVQFCGLTCHTVMHPEYTAYQSSPHARVACVQCHVGAGAGWYVKSKLSGARQVFNAALNTFPRPVPTPVHNLRPAQYTCEECHWPQKFYGAQLKTFTHYASDERNTIRQVQMLIKTGGGDPATGAPEGIHWHMNIGHQIEYVAADEKRQVIPYVQVRDVQGRVTEYFAKDSSLSKEQISKTARRIMDCVDCHNRPSHQYVPPEQSVDQSLFARRLDVSLPYIKQQAVAALTAQYASTPAATDGIAKHIQDFYESKYPGLYKSKQLEIRDAIAVIQGIYQRTTFPEMKVNWQVHPNNIGHMYFAGCFRCHDGQHVSPEGKVISKDCGACHTVINQQEGTAQLASTVTQHQFAHPVDIGDLSQVSCSDCHTGGVSP